MAEHGTFPFGRPSTDRPPRTPVGPAAAFVLGVYPSALHIRWTPPRWHAGAKPKPVSAIAVDVEPVVFWAGSSPDPDVLIGQWKNDVGFTDGDDPGCDGHVAGVRLNGSSGDSVQRRVLEPLQLDPNFVWMTDAVPWFFVKYGSGGRREQGDVIDDVYNPFARAAGRVLASLPARPQPSALIEGAVRTERDRLRREMLESDASLIVTLGEEARRVLLGCVDEARVEGRRIAWYALAHPGQRASKWIGAHDHWIGSVVV